MLFCDYSKAFDLVNHNIILAKLHKQGVPEYLLEWFASFLCNRQHVVQLGDRKHTMFFGLSRKTQKAYFVFWSQSKDPEIRQHISFSCLNQKTKKVHFVFWSKPKDSESILCFLIHEKKKPGNYNFFLSQSKLQESILCFLLRKVILFSGFSRNSKSIPCLLKGSESMLCFLSKSKD